MQSESYTYKDTEFLGFYGSFSLYFYTGFINIYMHINSFIIFINDICIQGYLLRILIFIKDTYILQTSEIKCNKWSYSFKEF